MARDLVLCTLGRSDVARALVDFDTELRPDDADLGAACGRLLGRIGVTTRYSSAPRPDGSLLFYAHHQHPVDAFLLPLLSDGAHQVNVLTLLHFACAVGPRYARRTITVAPSVDDWSERVGACYSNMARLSLLANTVGAGLMRGATQDASAVRRCLDHLRAGRDLCLFPAGLLGHGRWRRGLGAIVCDYMTNRSAYARPLYLAPVRVSGYDGALALRPARPARPLIVSLSGAHRPEALFGRFDLGRADTAQSIADVLSVRYHHAFRDEAS